MKNISKVLASGIVLYFHCYMFTAPLAYGYFGAILTIFLLYLIWSLDKSSTIGGEINFNENIARNTICLLVGIVTIVLVTSWSAFHADSYKNMIKIEASEFNKDITPIDQNHIRIVDHNMATKLGDKVLGEKQALGSRVELGSFTIQKVKNDLYWIAPLLHTDFFKWWKYSNEGTPGYIMVSATNERDVKLVTEVKGKPLSIKYQTKSFFGQDVERHLYLNGFMTRGITDFTFEVDDEGNPFYVATIFEKKVGFFGSDAVGVAIVNVQTGEIKEFNIDNTPTWVDRIQPHNFISTQLTDWGYLINGWINPSDKDRLKPTPGIELIYGNDGKSYWYTGMTSVGKDSSTVGFVLANTRTKESKWYKLSGAIENSAMESAQGKVQEKRYKATFPILYNVGGVPTYVMSLKDDAGLVKMIAFVTVQDYSIVGVGENINEALRDYQSVLASKGNAVTIDAKSNKVSLEKIVSRIGVDPKTGSYAIVLKDVKKLFFGTTSLSRKLAVTEPGDKVKIGFVENNEGEVSLLSFDNLDILVEKSENQQTVENRFEGVANQKEEKEIEKSSNAKWEKLTPKEREDLIKNVN